MKDLCVLGSLASSEFRSASEWLTDTKRCDFFDSDGELIKTRSDSPPSVVVIAQSRRGQYSESVVEKLNDAFPDARMVLLVGSWSEGETRSGSPLDGFERVYAAEFVARMKRWVEPASQLADAAGVNAVVVSHSDSFAEAVVEAIIASRGSAVAIRPTARLRIPQANVVIYDTHPHLECRVADVQRIQRQWGLPTIALVDFPRGLEIDELGILGISSVLPKPFSMDDLMFEMREQASCCSAAARQVDGSFPEERESAA